MAQRPAIGALDRWFRGGRMLGDGAMGTMLFGRGMAIDRGCDELNLSRPEMVAAVHRAYVDAGAQIVGTNTFGANAFRLERYGLRDRVREINLAGIRIARECVAPFAGGAYVAGAVGPLGVRVGFDEARAAFAEQIGALAEGGVDLLMVETMTSLTEAGAVLRAAREVAPGLRTVAMVTVGEDGDCLDGTAVETAAVRLAELGADAVGCNCSTGPASVLGAIERMRAATGLPLAAMPSAGLPGERGAYAMSPEEMAEFARAAIGAGAGLLGGCCGTTPEHIRAMRSSMSDFG
jgi:homocysteine S-methyltransferase